MQNDKNIFVNWSSFDRQRSQNNEYFAEIKAHYPQASYFTSAFQNPVAGELFPGGPLNLWPQGKSLTDLCAILSCMDLVITTNTGIAHVAAALGIPTITLFTGRLYCWEGYWPDLHTAFYPSMMPIGLTEDFKIAQLSESELQVSIFEKMQEILK